MDTIDHFETNNPLGNDFEPLKKNLKNGPFYGSSEPSHVTPSRQGPLWNLIAEINRFDDICLPLTINVAFGENLSTLRLHFWIHFQLININKERRL